MAMELQKPKRREPSQEPPQKTLEIPQKEDQEESKESKSPSAEPTLSSCSCSSSSSSSSPLVSDLQKNPRCAKRSGMPVQFSEEERRNSRAERQDGKKRKQAGAALLASEISKMSSSIRMLAEAIMSTVEVHSLTDLKAAVMSMGGFANMERIKAYAYLHKNHRNAEVFLSLDEEDRVVLMGIILKQLA